MPLSPKPEIPMCMLRHPPIRHFPSPVPCVPPGLFRVVDLGAAPGGWSMVAARIVHARGPRTPQQGAGRRGGGSRGGGAPPALPPPLPEGRLEAAERKGRRGGGAVVVAVDLLDMEADLPGVQVKERLMDTGAL